MDANVWEHFLCYLGRIKSNQQNTLHKNAVELNSLDVSTEGNTEKVEGMADLLKQCSLKETKSVIVLSSDSETDDDSIWSNNAKCKSYKRICENVHALVFHRILGSFYQCTNSTLFPYEKLRILSEDLRKFQQVFIHNEEELKYLWRNVVQWLLALKQSSDPTELKYDENFILILIDFMAQYINYVTSTFYKINESVKINETVNEIVQTLAAVLGGSILHILLVLLRIELKIEYRSILNPIFRKYLCDHSLCRASSDLIVYLRLILCFKRWKMITPLKADREAINELAVGKSIRSKKAECSIDLIDLTTEPILPKSVPKVNVKNRLFISISDLIGFAMEKEAYGTRILLIYTSLDLEDAITKYFQCYKRYVSLNADCLSMDVDPPSKEMSKLNLQPENYTTLTQRNYNDATSSRPQRRREQQNMDQQVVEKQSMDFTPHLNSNCYINKIRLSNLSNCNESTLRLKTTNAQSDISLRSKNNSFKDNLECIQIDLTAFDKDHILEDDHDKEQDNDNDNDNDNINDNDNENDNDNDNDNGNDNNNDNDNENNNNNDNDNENDNDNNDNDNDSLKKVLEKSDSETVSRQNLISNENALGTEPSSMPRIAAIPPRCRHLVESVATKPTRKEKHCIPGEVSSTTSSDYLLQTNNAQNIRTVLEHNTTPSAFQYNVSSLEVHSAGTLQNAREVGVVKVIQQRVSPCPSVVVSGTCKPGSLLLGVNTSDVLSENEDDNDLDCNSHIMSHALWKVVEEATSSTAEFPKTLPENALLLTRNEIKNKHSVANTKSKELEETKMISMDGPICSKYIEKTYTPLATSMKALDVSRAEEIIRTDEHLNLSLKTKSVIQEHDHEENPIEKNVGQDEIKQSQSLEYIKKNFDLGTDISTKRNEMTNTTILKNTIESTATFKFLSESKIDAIKNMENIDSVQCTNEKTTLQKQSGENIPATEINVNDTTINPFVEVVKLVPAKEQFVVENRMSDEQNNFTKSYDDTVDVEANDIESFLKEIDENLNEAERDDSNCFIETDSKQKLCNTKKNSTFYGDDFTYETANNSKIKNYSIENRKQDASAEFCMDVENTGLNDTNENKKEAQNSSRIISEETIKISNLLDGKNKILDVKSKEHEDKTTTEDDRFTVKMSKLGSSKSYHENINALMQTNTSNDKNIDFIDLNNEIKLNKEIIDINVKYGQNNESVTKDSKTADNSPVINTVPILNRVKALNKNSNEMDELSHLNIVERREEENVGIETSQILMSNTKRDIDSTICVNVDKTRDNINGSAECINKDFGDISERKGHMEADKTYSKDISIVPIKNSVEDTDVQISMNAIDECNKQPNFIVEKYLNALNVETKPKSQLTNEDVNETNKAAHPNARDINIFSENDAANTLTSKSENMDNVLKSTLEGNTPKTVTLGSLSVDYTSAILKPNVGPKEDDLIPEDQIITSEMKVEEFDSKSTPSEKFKNLEKKCWTSKISERITISVPQTVSKSTKLDELKISSLVNTTNKIEEEGVNKGDTDGALINLNEIKKSRIELKNTEADNNNICTVDTKEDKISTEQSSNKSKNEYIEAISENIARAQFSDENTTYLNQSDITEKLVPKIIDFSKECLNFSKIQNEEFEKINRNSEETLKVVAKNSLENVEHITLSDTQEILGSIEKTVCTEQRIKFHSNCEEQIIMIGNNNNTALTLENENVFATSQSYEDEKTEEIKDGNNIETNILNSNTQNEEFEGENRNFEETSKVVCKNSLESVQHIMLSDTQEILGSIEKTVCTEQRIKFHSNCEEQIIMIGNNNNTALTLENENVFATSQSYEDEKTEEIKDGNNIETNILNSNTQNEEFEGENRNSDETSKVVSKNSLEIVDQITLSDKQEILSSIEETVCPEKRIKFHSNGEEQLISICNNTALALEDKSVFATKQCDENEKEEELKDGNNSETNILYSKTQNEEFEGENSEETSKVASKTLIESVEHKTLSDKQEILSCIRETVCPDQRIKCNSNDGEQLLMSGNNNNSVFILEDESVFATKQSDEDAKKEEIKHENNSETNILYSKIQNEQFEWENRYSEEISKVVEHKTFSETKELSSSLEETVGPEQSFMIDSEYGEHLIMSGNNNNTALILEAESVFATKQNDEGEKKEEINDGNNSETNILSRADVLEDENTCLAEEKSKEDTAKDSSAQEEECIFNEQNIDSQRLKTEIDLKSQAPHSSTQHIDFQTPEKDIQQMNRKSNKILKKYNKKSARGDEKSSNQSKNDYIEAISESIIRAEFSDESTYINESDTNEKVGPEIIDTNQECSNIINIQNEEFEGEATNSEETSNVFPKNLLESVEHITLSDKQEIVSSIEEIVRQEQRIMNDSECGEQLIMSGNNNNTALILEDENVFAVKQKDEAEKIEEITDDNNGETNVTLSKSQNEEFEWENRYSEEISKVKISNKQLVMSGNNNNTAWTLEDESLFVTKQNYCNEKREEIKDENNSETNILSRTDVLEDENTYLAEEKSKEYTASSAQEEECFFNEQNLDSQRLKTEIDLKSQAPHSSTQHIDFQTPEKDIQQMNRKSNKIIKKYNKKSARANEEESSNHSKNDNIEAISESIIRHNESTYINESDTNEKVAPEIIDSNKECSNISQIQNKEFEWENRYSEEISKVVPKNVLESIEHKTLNDKQEILSSIQETVAPEQRIISDSKYGEQLIMSGNNNNTTLTPEDESVFATEKNGEGEKKEEITDGNSSETNILCSKIQNEEFEWENRYAEEISKTVPKNVLESVEHKTFSDKQEILNSIEETVAPEQRIMSESEYGEQLIMSSNNNNTALILEDESVFAAKQKDEDEKMEEITDDNNGEINILAPADALADGNTSLTGENSKENMAKDSNTQEDEIICNEPNLDSLTETKISKENIDDSSRNNSVTLKNLVVATTQIVSQCALYDSMHTEESTNVDHYDNDEVEKRGSSSTQEEKYIENVNYESSGAATFDMMQKSDISSKITEKIVTKEIQKVQENIEPESIQSILTTMEIKETRENIEDIEIFSISKDLITNYETNKVIPEVDLCSLDHKERRNLAPSSNVPEDIDDDLSKSYQKGDETPTNFDFEKPSLLKNNEKNENEKTSPTDTTQDNCRRSRHGRGTPLLDEELDGYVHRSTQESTVLKNVERNIYTSDTIGISKDKSLYNNNVTNSLTVSKDISSKSIHSLLDDDIEKRTPWKMRIKRRISLCSDINKEFNLDSNEDDKQILRTHDITDSEQRITRSTVRKVADERADDISKLNKKRMNHNSESDGSNADDGFDCVQDSWLNQLGLLKNTTKNIVAPNENITNVFMQKLEEKSKQQKEKNYTSEATASLSLNQMPINYKSEEIVAVSALLHMQNKRFNRNNADLSEQETINEIEALTCSKGKRGRPRKPMTRQSSSRMNAARVIEPEPILKSALKRESRSKSSVQKKVTFDMRSDLQVEEKNEFRKWSKAFNNLKAFRSAEGSLLKGGNKQTKRRLDEINARFKLDSISAITKGEDSSEIINLCKPNNTKETMISIEQSQYQKVRKRKISNITTRGDISHPGSTMLSRSASKSINRNKKLMGEDVIEIVNPIMISPKNRNDTGNCSEVQKSSCELQVLNSTSNKLFDNKANITTQPTTANDILMVKDELSSARKAPEQHTNLVVSKEVIVRTLEEKIQLAEPDKCSTQKHPGKMESLVVHRTRSSKRKRAVVRVRRLDSTKSDATCPLNDGEAVEMGFNFEEKKIKKEPEDESIDPIYNALDVTIKKEEDCTVANDCFMTLSDPYNLSFKEMNKQMKSTRKEIIVRPGDVILTEEIVNAQATLFTDSRKKKECLEKTISLSPSISSRNYAVIEKMSLQSDLKNVSKVIKKPQKSRVKRKENIRSAKRQEDSSKVIKDTVSQHICESNESRKDDSTEKPNKNIFEKESDKNTSSNSKHIKEEERGTSDEVSKAIVVSEESAVQFTEGVIAELKLLSPQNVLLEQDQSHIDPKEISSKGYQGLEVISQSKSEYTFTERANEQNIVCEDKEQRNTDKITEGVVDEVKLLSPQNVLLEEGQSDIDPKEIASNGYQGLEVISQSKSEYTFTERANEQTIVCEDKEQRTADKITEGVVDEVKLLSPQNVLLEEGQSDIDPKEISSNGYQGLEVISQSKSEYTFTERANEQNIVCEDKEQRTTDKIIEGVVDEVKLLSPQNVLLEEGQSDIDPKEISSNGYQGFEIISPSKIEYTFTERANEQNIVCEDKEQRTTDKIIEGVVDEVKLLSPQNVLLEEGQSAIDPKEIASNDYQGFEIISPSKIEYTFTERANEQNIVCEDKEQGTTDQITESVIAELKLLSPQNVLLEQDQSAIDSVEISSHGYQGFEVISPSQNECIFADRAIEEQNIVCEDKEQIAADKITVDVVAELKLLSPQNVLLEQDQSAIDSVEISSHGYQGFEVISPSQNECIFADRAIEEQNIVCEDKEQIAADKITVDVVAELKLLSPQNVLSEQGQSAIDPVEISSHGYQGFEVISPSKSEYIFTEGVIEEQNIVCEDKEQIAADKITEGLVTELKLSSPHNVLLDQGQSAINPVEISSHDYQGLQVISSSQSDHIFTERVIEEQNIACENKGQIAADKITEGLVSELKLLSPQNVLSEQGQSAIDPVEISSHGYQGFEVISPSKSEYIFTEGVIEEQNIVCEDKEQIAADKITEGLVAELKLLSPQNVLLDQGQSVIDPEEISSNGYQGFEVISPSKNEYIFTERTIEEENIICEDKEQIVADKITEDVVAELKLLSPQNVLLDQGQSVIDPVEISSHGYQGFEVISPSQNEHICTERTIEEENIVCEDKEQIATDKITEEVAAELKLLSPPNVLLEQGQSVIDTEEISSNGYQGFEVISPSKSEYIFTERAIEEQKIVFEDKEQITAHKITEGVIAELKLLSPQNVPLEQGQSSIDPQEISSNGYQGFEVISPSQREYIFTEPANEEQIIVCEDNEQRTADKITEGVIAELKLLSPQNVLLEQGQSSIDPKEISSNGYHGFEVLSPNQSDYIFTERAIEKQNTVCKDKEQRTAELLDSAIERVLGISPVISQPKQKAQNIEIAEIKQRNLPKTTTEQLDYAIDAILGQNNKTKQNKVFNNLSEQIKSLDSTPSTSIGEENKCSNKMPSENIIDNEFEQSTAHILDQSVDIVLGHCSSPKNYLESQLSSDTTESVFKRNVCKPEETLYESMKVMNKKYFTDMKTVSANVPEALFADDDSDNSNSESGGEELKFFTPILSLDDLLTKKTDEILEIPSCTNSDFNCDQEPPVAFGSPEETRECLVTPNFSIELEVATSRSVNESANKNISDLSSISDIIPLGIPIDLIMTNETFADVMDIMLLDQVQQSIEYTTSGKSQVEKTNNQISIPVSSQKHNVCTSEILESCTSTNNACPDTMAIDQEILYNTINPLDEVEVSTNNGFDLHGNVTVEDLLADDGDDLFAFSELDKTRSRSNSYLNDSESCSNSPQEVVESLEITTKAIACDHSYNKEIKYPECIESVPNMFDSKLKSHPSPFWKVLKNNDMKTSTPKRDSAFQKHVNNDKVNKISGGTSESLTVSPEKIQAYNPLTQNKPQPKLKWHSAPHGKVLKNGDTNTPVKSESALIEHKDDHVIKKVFENTVDSPRVSREIKLAPKKLFNNIPEPELDHVRFPSPDLTNDEEDSIMPPKDGDKSIAKKESSSLPILLKQSYSPSTITQPIITIQSQTNRLQRIDPIPKKDQINHDYKEFSSNLDVSTIESNFRDQSKHITKVEDFSIKETKNNISLKRENTPTLDEPPYKKHCPKTSKKLLTSDDIFNILKSKSLVACKPPLKHEVVSSCSFPNTVVTETRKDRPSNEQTYAETRRKTRSETSGKSMFEKPVSTENIVENIRKNAASKGNTSHMKPETFVHVGKSETSHKKEDNNSIIEFEVKYAESKELGEHISSTSTKSDKSISTTQTHKNPLVVNKETRYSTRSSMEFAKMFVKKVSEKPTYIPPTPKRDTTMKFIPKPSAEPIAMSPKLSPKQSPIFLVTKTEGPYTEPLVKHNSTPSPTSVYNRHHPYHNSPNSTKPSRNQHKYQRAASFVESKQPTNSHTSVATVKKQEHKHNSTPSPTSVYNRHHPYHNSPNNTKPSRNQQKYQRAASFVESKQPTNSHTSLVTIKKQEPAKPASEQKLHQITTRSSKMSPITSLPHNTALNTKLVVDNVKLCEAEEAELAAILEDYKRSLPVAKEYREHREQTRLLRLYEEKLRVEFLERKKNHIKQSQNLMAETKCLKRRPYVEPYDKNYMKPIFPPASNAISSTSRHSQHHSQPMHYKPSHTGQKYINKFGEIEKNVAFGRNGTDVQPKTPLTITTAWEHKSASVDEIMEHLAKMKKT